MSAPSCALGGRDWLRKRDAFLFGGRLLELVRIHAMTAFVQSARRSSSRRSQAGTKR